jgi:hypothetical protein
MANVPAVDPFRRHDTDQAAGDRVGGSKLDGNELTVHRDAVNGKLAPKCNPGSMFNGNPS